MATSDTQGDALSTLLGRLYYDPRHPASYSSANKLFEYAREINPNVSLSQVKDWLSGQLTYTLHRQARRKWKREKYFVSTLNEQWQADLTFLNEFQRENHGYKYVLTVIDCFSKYAWAKPLKTKTAQEMKKVLSEIFAERKPATLQTDKGTEFDSRAMRTFYKQHDIVYFTTSSPEIKCSIVERFNRTLKNKMFKIFTTVGDRVWHDKLDDIMHSYNNTRHRSIKMAPAQVNFTNAHHVLRNLYSGWVPEKHEVKLQAGNQVRQKYMLKPFDRGFYPNWTDQVYKVKGNISGEKPRYLLDDQSKRRFYPEELQKVNPTLYRIERIISRKGTGRNIKYFVKWLNYPASSNSWISKNDVIQMRQQMPRQQ